MFQNFLRTRSKLNSQYALLMARLKGTKDATGKMVPDDVQTKLPDLILKANSIVRQFHASVQSFRWDFHCLVPSIQNCRWDRRYANRCLFE